jgi:hypothetical protein
MERVEAAQGRCERQNLSKHQPLPTPRRDGGNGGPHSEAIVRNDVPAEPARPDAVTKVLVMVDREKQFVVLKSPLED